MEGGREIEKGWAVSIRHLAGEGLGAVILIPDKKRGET